MDEETVERSQHDIVPARSQQNALSNKETEKAFFETTLMQAGQTANEARQHDVFAEYHATCRPNTLKRQFYDLRCLCTFLLEQKQVRLTPLELALSPQAWHGMTYGLLADFRTWMLQQGFSIGTINNRIATVHKYCQLAGPPPKGIGVISEQELRAILTISGYAGKVARNVDQHRLSNKTPTRVGRKKADFTRLSAQEAVQLRRTTTPSPPPQRFPREHDQVLQARDAVMWSLLDEHLLRVSELVTLAIEDVDLEEKTITVYREKGNETWMYEMGPQTEAHLQVYLKQLQALGRTHGPLFLGYGDKPMTTSAINKRVGKLGEQLGFGKNADLEAKEKRQGRHKQRLSPHDLRHHGAITLLNEGTPLNELQAIGGWRTAHIPLQYAKLSKNAVIRSPKRRKMQAGEE